MSKKPIKGHAPMWELRIGALRVFFVEHDGAFWVLGGCRKDDQANAIKAAAKRMEALRR